LVRWTMPTSQNGKLSPSLSAFRYVAGLIRFCGFRGSRDNRCIGIIINRR